MPDTAKIGVITDLHYTDALSEDLRSKYSESGYRYYSQATANLTAAVAAWNAFVCDCAVEVGDYIELHSTNGNDGNTNTHDTGAEGETILAAVEAIYDDFTGERYHVIGNWDILDYDFAIQADFFDKIENGDATTVPDANLPTTDTHAYIAGGSKTGQNIARYYAFKITDEVYGIILDSSGIAATLLYDWDFRKEIHGGVPTPPNGYVTENQRTWLAAFLAANTDKQFMIFIHNWLYPSPELFTFPTSYYYCLNAAVVRGILEAHNAAMVSAENEGRVLMVVQGHHHPGGAGWWTEIPSYRTAIVTPVQTYNDIKYFTPRGSICGGGSSAEAVNLDAACAYYVLEVGQFVSNVWDTRITGYGTNPGGENESATAYYVF